MTASSSSATELAVYSGSIAALAGGTVLAVDECICADCQRYLREGRDGDVRAEAIIFASGRRERIVHARWSSVGR